MDRTWAELSEGLEVLGSGVAFVIPKPILGILRVHFGHKVVAGDFGKHARSRDGVTSGVSINKGSLRMERGENVGSVDKGMIGNGRELNKGLVHGAETGLKDIYGIDDLHIHSSDSPGDQG